MGRVVPCCLVPPAAGWPSCVVEPRQAKQGKGTKWPFASPSPRHGLLRLAIWLTGALHAQAPRAAQAAQARRLRMRAADASSFAPRVTPAVDA